tara:strand:+ start:1429 stop:1686 length:258 start_codon:yes stop_codon:yes gene_type:complete
MKALEQYVESTNRWNAMFKKAPMSLDSAVDRKELAQYIDSALSPENLSCDGELSHTAARKKYMNLSRVAKQLMQLDDSVVCYELL